MPWVSFKFHTHSLLPTLWSSHSSSSQGIWSMTFALLLLSGSLVRGAQHDQAVIQDLSLKNSLLCPHMKTFLKLPLHPCWDPVPLIQQNLKWLQWNIQIQQMSPWEIMGLFIPTIGPQHYLSHAFFCTSSWRRAPWPCSLWTLTQHFSRNFNRTFWHCISSAASVGSPSGPYALRFHVPIVTSVLLDKDKHWSDVHPINAKILVFC